MSATYLMVPGLTNSGPEHWQTFWEGGRYESFHRIRQDEWDHPVCADWIARIESEVRAFGPEDVILAAHSLGCTAVAQWARKYGTVIKGAMLVAPSDCEAPTYKFDTKGFTPIPLDPLPFRTLVVASANDEYVSLERARQFAEAWGSEFIDIGEAGHINAASGHGPWEEGLKLLSRLD